MAQGIKIILLMGSMIFLLSFLRIKNDNYRLVNNHFFDASVSFISHENSKDTGINYENIIIDLIGPEAFGIYDSPVYSLRIKNLTNKAIEFELMVNADNGNIILKENKILVEEYQNGHIDFEIGNYNIDFPINLTYEVYSQKKLIKHDEKKVMVATDYSMRSFDISGLIQASRITKSNFRIPSESSENFFITLIFSTSKYITFLKKISLIDNFMINEIYFELKRFLDDYSELKLIKKDARPAFLEKYYIPDKGIKKFPEDKNIDLESTLLVLFLARLIPEINYEINAVRVINNLKNNFREKILKKAFCILIMAEYGVFFKDISYNYLMTIREKKISIFYYKYFLKYKINYDNNNIYKEINKEYEIFFDKFVISQDFYKIITAYFNAADIDYDSINFYSNLLNIIVGKALIINRLFDKDKGNNPVEFSFVSNVLKDFEARINENDIVYKKYRFEIMDNTDSGSRFINYSIEKKSDGQLYYLFIVEYKTVSLPVTQDNATEIHTDFFDGDGNLLDPGELRFDLGRIYYINFYIKSDSRLSDIFIKPLSCNGFETDLNNIFMNNGRCMFINKTDKYIFLDNINGGLNILKYQVIAKNKGRYIITGTSFFNINNIYSYFIDAKSNVYIE